MFDRVMQSFKKHIGEKQIDINIISEKKYGSNKIEYALSTDDLMASISVLSDCTYDFMAIDVESESVLMVKTLNFRNVDDLLNQMKEDIDEFCDMQKNNIHHL